MLLYVVLMDLWAVSTTPRAVEARLQAREEAEQARDAAEASLGAAAQAIFSIRYYVYDYYDWL